MRESYERVGEAIVVEDKIAGSAIIKCIPYGNTTNLGSEFNINEKIKLDDDTEIDVSEYIEAIWLMTDSNRRTAPDVTAGSTVILYKHIAGDEYYWREETTQLNKRKLEEITYMLSNRPLGEESEDNVPLEVCNYMVTFSTLNKTIRLETSANDGEAASYIWNMDTKNGLYLVEDNFNNAIMLDSPNGEHFVVLNESKNVKTKNIVTLATGDTIDYRQGSYILAIDGLTMVNTNAFAWKSKDIALEVEQLLAYVKKLDMNVTDEVAMTLGKLLLYVTKGPLEVFAPEFNVMSANTTFTGAVNVAGGIVVNSFSVGGAAPKAVAPAESKAKAIDVKPWEDGKKAAIEKFERFKTEDSEEIEASEGEKGKDPEKPQEEQPEPDKPTKFCAEVDEPITLSSKNGGVTITGTAGNVEISGTKVKIAGASGETLASILGEVITELATLSATVDSLGAPVDAVQAMAGKMAPLLTKLKADHE